MNLSDTRGRQFRFWFPIGLAMVSILTGAGATTASISGRLAETERRVDAIERDRNAKLADYQQFKTDLRGDLTEIKTDLDWVRRALQRRGFSQ